MRWLGRLIVIMIVVGSWYLNTSAQGRTFRSATELVNLNVTVIGSDLEHVAGLRQDQFEVFEDGVPQTLKFFASGELPLDVILLLDTSGSMAASMPLVRTAATRFVRALRLGDRVSVMGISNGLRVLEPFTTDLTAALAAIAQTKASGRTPLYSSIYTALRELGKLAGSYQAEARRQALVVLTDGQDTASSFGFDELMTVIRRHAVPIYTVAPRPSSTIRAQREAIFGESSHEQDFELRKVAVESGARAFFPSALHELAGVYDDIASELANQYALGYQSTNLKRDGGFRRIAVRITAPGVSWRTRSGYVAQRESGIARTPVSGLQLSVSGPQLPTSSDR